MKAARVQKEKLKTELEQILAELQGSALSKEARSELLRRKSKVLQALKEPAAPIQDSGAATFDKTGDRLCTSDPMVIIKVKRNGDESGPVHDISGTMLQQLLDAVSARTGILARRLYRDQPDVSSKQGIMIIDFDALPPGYVLLTSPPAGRPTSEEEDGAAHKESWVEMQGAAARQATGPVFMALRDVGSRIPVVDFRSLSRGELVRVSRGEGYIDVAVVRRRRVAALANAGMLVSRPASRK